MAPTMHPFIPWHRWLRALPIRRALHGADTPAGRKGVACNQRHRRSSCWRERLSCSDAQVYKQLGDRQSGPHGSISSCTTVQFRTVWFALFGSSSDQSDSYPRLQAPAQSSVTPWPTRSLHPGLHRSSSANSIRASSSPAVLAARRTMSLKS